MKKIFIIFLFIIFSSSFSLAKDDEKITVEEIENIFFENKRKYPIINVEIVNRDKGREYYDKYLEIKNKWNKLAQKEDEAFLSKEKKEIKQIAK